MALKRIILCADDFGLSPAVSRGIAELLGMGRLTATSCMVNYPEFPRDAAMLAPFAGSADLGLHFSLTDSRSLTGVALECHLRPPPFPAMRAEVERQIAKFRDALGRLPDYIDGHQHVHVLPVVRDAVVQAAAQIGAYVRNTTEPIGPSLWGRPSPLQSLYLSRAARGLVRLAQTAGVETNRGFRGVRSFGEKVPFGSLFREMIAGAGEGTLVMCHPGHADAALRERDPVVEQRGDEWRYFAGPEFESDLRDAGLTIGRFRDMRLAPC